MSSVTVYVGNLSWNTTDESLRDAFGQYGAVSNSTVIKDRDTGRSRGFGYVTFGSQSEADEAIAQMNEQDFEGSRIKVNLAERSAAGGTRVGGTFGGVRW
jgi:RNA recognition motif-containing protein